MKDQSIKTEVEDKVDSYNFDRKGKKSYIIPGLLVLLLVCATGYIAYDKWRDYSNNQKAEIFTAGVEYGYDLRLLEVFNEGLNCNEPININNGSLEINLIAIECLNIPQQQG